MPFQPTYQQVHVDRPLTMISVAFIQNPNAFVARRAFPTIGVSKQSDRYFQYPRGHFFRDQMQKRAPATESAGTGFDVDNTPSYFADVYALHKDVPDEIRANVDEPLDMDRDVTLFLTQQALIHAEKVWVNGFFKAATWTGGDAAATNAGTNTSVTVPLRWDQATADPIVQVRLWKRTILGLTGYMPNRIVLGRAAFDTAIDNPLVISRVNAGQTPGGPAMANAERLAQLWGLDEVLVMDSVENTAAEGVADAFSFIGGKKALLVYTPPTPGIMTPSAGYTFSWTGLLGQNAGPSGTLIRNLRLDRSLADRIEIQQAYGMKQVSSDLGFFCDTVVN